MENTTQGRECQSNNPANEIEKTKKEVALLALQELKKELTKEAPDLRKIEILGYTAIQTGSL